MCSGCRGDYEGDNNYARSQKAHRAGLRGDKPFSRGHFARPEQSLPEVRGYRHENAPSGLPTGKLGSTSGYEVTVGLDTIVVKYNAPPAPTVDSDRRFGALPTGWDNNPHGHKRSSLTSARNYGTPGTLAERFPVYFRRLTNFGLAVLRGTAAEIARLLKRLRVA
jgi:hypothetical protein